MPGLTSHKLAFVAAFGCLLATPAPASPPTTPRSEVWIPANTGITAIAEADGILYLGGDFDYSGQYTGTSAILDDTTGTILNIPRTAGYVSAAASDGAGGWYVAGRIDAVDGIIRSGVVHLLADGTLDAAWNAGSINSAPAAMAVAGGRVYIGGDFTIAGGTARSRIAALNASDGSVTAWNPGADSNVDALAVSGNTVYAGGAFTNIGGQNRNRLAALDATINTNNATPWDPNANDRVVALALSGSTLYAGGSFTTIGGAARNRIAALDTTINTNNATAWDPNPNDHVVALALSGSTLYAGGSFTTIGGAARSRIAALDTTINTNNATLWNPGASWTVGALLVVENTLYLGGDFTTVAGVPRKRIAAVDRVTGAALPFDPKTGGKVEALAHQGDKVFVGGFFASIGGLIRNHAVAVDAATGVVTPWDPNVDAPINAIATASGGGPVYLGGDFLNVGGSPRNRLAAVSKGSGALTAWNPNANSQVHALVLSGNTLYVGGGFGFIAGVTRNRIAALDTTIDTNNATAWNPSATISVNSLLLSGNTLYVGGYFTTIGGAARNRLAALDTTINTNNATAWDPNADNGVLCMALAGSTLYAGGEFTNIGGAVRSRIAALDTSIDTNQATAWDPNANQIVYALAIGPPPAIFVGGSFSNIGGQARTGLVELDRTLNTNNVTAWTTGTNGFVFALSTNGPVLYAGGVIISLTIGQPLRCLSIYDSNSTQWIPPTPGNWSNAANWNTGVVPDNFGPNSFTAEIRANSSVVSQDVSPQVTIDALDLPEDRTVNVTGGNLRIATGAGINDNGVLTIANSRSLEANASMSIDGLGSLVLSGPNSQLAATMPGAVVTNGNGHTITGQGVVSAQFANNGIIEAQGAGTTLTFNAAGFSTNNAILRSTNGGTMLLSNPLISGTGRYFADGGTLRVSSGGPPAFVSGAKLDATNGGIVEVSGPVGIILSGSATLTSGGVYQGVSGASASLSAGDIDITMDNDGGQMLLDSAMSAHTTRTLNVTGCGVQLLRGCIPPVLNVTGGATATIGGSINLAGQADVRVNSSVPVQVGGDFNNQLTSPGSFDWNSGALRLTGSGPGYFELAGQNVGPRCPAGFTNNFSMGTVELALLSDIEFRDTFDNAAGAGCEALYITQLTLQPGSTIRINGCRVYFVNLTPGGNVIITNGGALMQTTDADMNGDTLVNGLDISLFVKVLLGQPGNVSAADMNGDGLANSLDIPLFLDVLTTSCPP